MCRQKQYAHEIIYNWCLASEDDCRRNGAENWTATLGVDEEDEEEEEKAEVVLPKESEIIVVH